MNRYNSRYDEYRDEIIEMKNTYPTISFQIICDFLNSKYDFKKMKPHSMRYWFFRSTEKKDNTYYFKKEYIKFVEKRERMQK